MYVSYYPDQNCHHKCSIPVDSNEAILKTKRLLSRLNGFCSWILVALNLEFVY